MNSRKLEGRTFSFNVLPLLLLLLFAPPRGRALNGSSTPYASAFCNPALRNYCPNHVACPSNVTRMCGFPTQMTDRVINVILTAHNECRNTVPTKGATTSKGREWAHGHRPGVRLQQLPSSADMTLLTWDTELSQVAHLWVASCVVEKEAFNLSLMGNVSMKDKPIPGSRSKAAFCFDVPRFKVNGWIWIMPGESYSPIYKLWEEHLWSLCANISTTLPEHLIESYRPPTDKREFSEAGVCLLWAHASRVGCAQRRERGMAASRSFVALACLYAPSPLRPGRPVYRRGGFASNCVDTTAAADSRMFHLCTTGRSVDDIIPTVVVVLCALALGFVVFFSVESAM